MERTEVVFKSANKTQTCASDPLGGRLKSFSAGCLNVGDVDSSDSNSGIEHDKRPPGGQELQEVVDVHLVSQAFSYGKYLLFSSATEAPMNLQGLWADGPSSSWNGDYHLNINMQESYWAADAVGAGEGTREVMQPLMKFISDLSKAGAVTAKDVYGIEKGWVAHGFTDNRMHCGMIGEAQWSLCVTCGAWLALQAFDHLTFHFNRSLLLLVVLPSLRGIAEFFLEYMYIDPFTGQTHTGPTTSPENSYTYKIEDKISTHVLMEQKNIERLSTLIRLKAEEKVRRGISKTDTPLPLGQQPQQLLLKQQQKFIREQQEQQEQQNLQIQLNISREKLRQFEQENVAFIAFSPALDISVLRQAANAFTMATQWAARHDGQHDDGLTYKTRESDQKLALAFTTAITQMTGHALPVNGLTGRTLEYPAPLLSPFSGAEKSDIGEEYKVAQKDAENMNISGK